MVFASDEEVIVMDNLPATDWLLSEVVAYTTEEDGEVTYHFRFSDDFVGFMVKENG